MKKNLKIFCTILITLFLLNFTHTFAQVISGLTYDNITQSSVTIKWNTDQASDSKIKWMPADSNYQPLVFTDSVYSSQMLAVHSITLNNLQPAVIYRYVAMSQNGPVMAVDSGYFVTASNSSGIMRVYFNHSIDTSVMATDSAAGNFDFASVFVNRIDSAMHSIDITLWEFNDITEISTALVKAKNRGVKIRFIYTDDVGTSPLIDTLLLHGITVFKRNYDTAHSMHNKFWIFDNRYNSNANNKFLLTGSTNVTHAQLHSDKNNIITVQDEALCNVYQREFEEMWGSHTDIHNPVRAKFGREKADNTPHILNISGVRTEVYFAPSDSTEKNITRIMMDYTTQSVYFCMLKFYLRNIEDTMHNLFNHGMVIKGVFDSSCIKSHISVYPRMKGEPVAGTWSPHADVFFDPISGLIHHKYFIIDAGSASGNKITGTGSFNFEPDASFRNDENIMIIFNDRINNLYYQEFAARFKESGGLIENSVEEKAISESAIYNYPNPFKNSTSIKFYLAESGDVKISVFDILGCKINTAEYKNMTSGIHEYLFDGSGLPGGVYFYNITGKDFSETKKMVLSK